MTACRQYEKWMGEALYHELSPRRQRRFDAHLESCPDCAARYQQLAATLRQMDRREPAVMPPAYWADYWRRLSARLPAEEARRPRLAWTDWLPSLGTPWRPAWASVALALLLVTAGVFLGRRALAPRSGAQLALPHPAARAEFDQLASRYLERSKLILLGLDNFDTDEDDLIAINFPRQQLISQDLLRQGHSLRSRAAVMGDPPLDHLIDGIQRVLLQLANSEEDDLVWTVRLVQIGVQANDLLLRINLTQIERQEHSRPHREAPSPQRSSLMSI